MTRRYLDRITGFLLRTDGTVRERTIRSGLWISAASGCIRILEFTRTIVLARLLVPELFGLMSIVLFFRGAIDVFTSTSFGSALIYRQDDLEEAANTAWTLNILRGLLLFVGTFVAAPLVAAFYGQTILTTALRFIAFAFVVESFGNINTVIYEKSLNYRVITIARIITSFANIFVVILMAWLYRNIWALLIGSFMASFSSAAMSFVIQRKWPRLGFNKTLSLELFHYAKYLTGSGILVFLTLNGADVVLGKLLSMQQLGYYSYAFALANLPATHITSVVSEVIFPAYNAIKSDLEKLRAAFLKIFKIISMVSIPAAFGILALSREIIVLLLGAKWEPAVAPLRVLIIFGLVRSLAATSGPILNAIGKPEVVFWVVFGKLCLIAALLVPFIRLWGTVGAAVALTVPMLMEQVFLWQVIRKLLKVDLMPFVTSTATTLLLSVLMSSAIALAKKFLTIETLPVLLVNIVGGFAFYATLTCLFNKGAVLELAELRRK